MFYLIDLMEFLSLVAVAAFDYMSRNFYHDYFSFYFQLFSCSAIQLIDFNDLLAVSFKEFLEQEILLFHCQEQNVNLVIIIIIDYYLNLFINYYLSKLKYLMKSHCSTLSLQNHVMLQPCVSSYSIVAHYLYLLYCLFSGNDLIHELLSDLCCYCLCFQLTLIEDENYDIQYYCFFHVNIINWKGLMLQMCFDDSALKFYVQFFNFMSLLLIAYFDFSVYLKFDYFIQNYSIVLKPFHHFQEFFFPMTQVFFEFDQDYLKECYLT